MKKTVLFLLLVAILGCNIKKEKLQLERKVFNELFLELIDSAYVDFRLMTPPYPPPPNGIVLSEKQKKENLENYKKFLAEFEKRKAEIEKDTTRIVLAIVEKTFPLDSSSFKNLSGNYKEIEPKSQYSGAKNENKIDLSIFNNHKKYRFKKYSEFPKGRKIWRTNYPFELGAIISFSKIYFDKKKEYGILECGVTRGRLNGNGLKFFIKKVSGKWKIEKIEGTWIS